MKIKFSALDRQYLDSAPELEQKALEVLRSGYYSGGAESEHFESAFADYCGAPFASGVSTGSAAIQIALQSLGIGAGDEVIVPAHTFIATALAVLHAGARPVFADTDDSWGNIDPEKLPAPGPAVKALIAVHLYGKLCDMSAVREYCTHHGLFLIEDAAQAHGAADAHGNKAGSLGDAGCFSFYPTKNLGSFGEGGAVVCRSEAMHTSIRQWRDYGRISRYLHELPGSNHRLHAIQAALLTISLKKLDQRNQARRKLAESYIRRINNEFLRLPEIPPIPESHVWHLFVIRTAHRDALINQLEAAGIQSLIHYPLPCHLQPVFTDFGHRKGDFPVSERWAEECLSLPLHPFLREDEVDYLCETLNQFRP
jgi:dTDP-4-amino-4,6-dideoxygalactose transaminase